MKSLLLGLGFGLCFACYSPAQVASPTPRPTPPPGPLIARRAPDFADWVVTTTIKNPNASPASSPGATPGAASTDAKAKPTTQIMKVTKTGDVRHVSNATSDGIKSEIWCKAATQVIFRPEWKEPLLSTGENVWDAARIDFSRGDFAGFDWISPANFVDVRKVSGRDCLVFQDRILPFGVDPKEKPVNADGSPAKPIDFEKLKVAAVACTDLETRLPVVLQVGDSTIAYKFDDPPTAMLTLSPEALKTIKTADQKRQLLLRKPAQP